MLNAQNATDRSNRAKAEKSQNVSGYFGEGNLYKNDDRLTIVGMR